VITYEYPLNERIRTLLRLENLFERANHFVAEEDSRAHHAALIRCLKSGSRRRAELKSDLLQSSNDRSKSCWVRNNPKSRKACSGRSSPTSSARARRFSHDRQDRPVPSRKRLADVDQAAQRDPGGVCEFDLPPTISGCTAKGAARNRPRHLDLPLLPIRDASSIVLKLLREGGKPVKHVAHRAAFSQMLGGRCRRWCASGCRANRSSFRDQRQPLRAERPLQHFRTRDSEADVEFELTFCNL